MAALFYESRTPSFLSPAPAFGFNDLAQIYAMEPVAYHEARVALERREIEYGAQWYRHNAKMAHKAWESHKPWWLYL